MLTIGTLVTCDKRLGKVVSVNVRRGKALVMWSGSLVAGWSRLGALKVVF